ncbi:exodeoxyribonuclease VII, small subunit [Ruminiclostridium papyrosolvens DSM 2782]|uniref:Exodeoxyribonuclease 7 small subunit n=1 Tax=Ruminiclostridium papyrosolvens DSM 2782 TaxID=588581 RepID=F1TAN3_9FIRM|nr:exodeoxyribonuclease VII small subunit [Ruminiclostridium papyrosolvens]EGD48576.1 exodeoxyribonuclease VII, small subunit [Ruminiclostridium papyrosolvens DSM 2782]WES32668.1 exodeoxyribonuclease VII small subunit [Ruminiclostridium papyrosolvens DSM 2782]
MSKSVKIEKSFEEAIAELEQIVVKLEKGEATLEESINSFQQGIELSRYCAAKLDEAEKKITMLIQNEEGNLEEKDFNL